MIWYGVDAVQGGAAVLVAVVVLLVLAGRLVPRRQVEDLRADRDARLRELIADRDDWRRAHHESEAARHLLERQADELLEMSRTATHLLVELRRARPKEAAHALDPPTAP